MSNQSPSVKHIPSEDTVRCTTCLWQGSEEALVDVPEDAASGIYYKGCPHCQDDVGLEDIEEDE